MEKLKLKVNKKTMAIYNSAFDAADDAETLEKIFGVYAPKIQDTLRKNAFFLCLNGAKLNCGNGIKYIIEEVK